ncbi:MAG: 30S ribosomal protein S9 [Thermoguttaceae bacterium]|jgi:small subunit ribosomal protein S9
MAEATITGKGTNDVLGTGRRKTSVARVRVRPGQGKILINGREFEEYFRIEQQRQSLLAPLVKTGMREKVDVIILANGGGGNSQADACKLGIARALKTMDHELEPTLREYNYLTRDSRMKERKKYGLRGARRGTQFSKR